MASRLTDERCIAIAQGYCKSGFNKTNGLKAVKNSEGSQFYSNSYCQTIGHKLYSNIRVKAEIDKIIAETQRETGITVAYIQSEHQRLAALAEAKGDVGVATRNKELLGKTIGAYMEKQVILDDVEDLTEKEAAEARRIAGLMLDKGLKIRAG